MQTGSHESPAIEASICRSVPGTRLRSTRVSTKRFRARLRSTCWQGRLRGAENNAAPKPLEPLKRQRVNQQLENRQLMRRQAVNRQPAQDATGEQATGEQTTNDSICTLTRFTSHQPMFNFATFIWISEDIEHHAVQIVAVVS